MHMVRQDGSSDNFEGSFALRLAHGLAETANIVVMLKERGTAMGRPGQEDGAAGQGKRILPVFLNKGA